MLSAIILWVDMLSAFMLTFVMPNVFMP
jgi:hypothetical protein